MKKITFLFKAAVLFITGLQLQTSSAQQTGIFADSIVWGSGKRIEEFNVPASYNPAKKYKLIIGLHGLGGNPLYVYNFTSLMDGSNPSSPFNDNTIAVCPQATGTNTDFWTPVGDTGLITHAMADAMAMYNIDPDYIYLNGFSLGGRAALRYGLLNYKRFRGLFLWVPAIQSMSEADDLASFTYVYPNARYIPINMSVATNDGLIYNDVEAYQHLNHAGGISYLHVLYNYNHAPSPDDYTIDAVNFIDKNAVSYMTNDAGIYNILSPLNVVCSGSITPKIIIQNKGIGTLTSATVNYQVDGGTINTYNWTGSLKQLDRNTITLPMQTVSAGAHSLKVYTTMPNGATDNFPGNDQQTINFNYITNGSAATIAEDFEGNTMFPPDWRSPAGWRQTGTDSTFYWELDTATGGSNGSKTCIHFDNAAQYPGLAAPDNAGHHYDLLTKEYDFSIATAPVLTYDYAYAPMELSGNVLSDSLNVKYSEDCGSTWTALLKKDGVSLNTSGTSTWGDKATGAFLGPTSSQWKTETINLSSLIGKPDVMFAFENVCEKGNLMYLDNISLTGATGIAEQQEKNSMNVYPNPTSGVFSVTAGNSSQYKIEIYNVMGEEIQKLAIDNKQLATNSQTTIDISSQSSGIYFLKIINADGSSTTKKIIRE